MTLSNPELSVERAKIGIITALAKEFAAVEAMLEEPVPWTVPGRGAGRRYLVGRIPARGSSESHTVVLALLLDMGNNSAAARATQMLQDLPGVQHIIMCGIAGGVPAQDHPEEHVRLGDIVVSDRQGVVQYDFIKQTPEDIEYRAPPRPPSAELLESVQLLQVGSLKGERPWEALLQRASHLEDSARPPDDLDARGEPIQHPPDSRRRAGMPQIFTGPIASANRLLKDARYRDALRKRFGVKAVEMEGSGIADATWLSERAGYLVVRGICDYCDERKGDRWQGHAAVTAAAYTRALIESMPPSIGGSGTTRSPSATGNNAAQIVAILLLAGFMFWVFELRSWMFPPGTPGCARAEAPTPHGWSGRSGFCRDVPDGSCRTFSGQVPLITGTCKEGIMIGDWAAMYLDGTPHWSGRFTSFGAATGEWFFREPDGKEIKGHYEEGRKDGHWSEWATGRQGPLRFEGRYSMGERQGTWSAYLEPGHELVREVTFKDHQKDGIESIKCRYGAEHRVYKKGVDAQHSYWTDAHGAEVFRVVGVGPTLKWTDVSTGEEGTLDDLRQRLTAVQTKLGCYDLTPPAVWNANP